MILATVGTQLPFPRLISMLDTLAAEFELHIIAQTCEPGTIYPHLETHVQLSPSDFNVLLYRANIIISHAGIGTIINAGRAVKPIILVPRRAALGEHRNEHQLTTVAQFGSREGIYPAHDEEALRALIKRTDLKPVQLGNPHAIAPLIAKLRETIDNR